MARGVAALAWMLALAGCASTPSVAPVDTGAPLSERWTLQGRIGVKSADESLSGNMLWKHRGGADELLLTSPLGQGVARIVRDPSGVTLEVPNQPARRAADAEALTRAVLGYGLPVAGLSWWVQARPAPGSTFEAARDNRNRFEQIRQDGWTIAYLRYADDAPDRPQKLALTRDGLEIRLVVDSWKSE